MSVNLKNKTQLQVLTNGSFIKIKKSFIQKQYFLEKDIFNNLLWKNFSKTKKKENLEYKKKFLKNKNKFKLK